MVFSVQLATEFTSAAAPRTVLQPAIVRALPIRTTVTSFRTMIAPPFCVRNEHDRSYGCLSSSLTGRLAVHRILRAVRDRIHVLGGAADRIACGSGKRRADQKHGGCLLEHRLSSSWSINRGCT